MMKNTKFTVLLALCSMIFLASCKDTPKSTEKKQEVPKEEKVVKKEEPKEVLLEEYAMKVDFTFETDQPGIFQIKFNAQDPKYTNLKNLTVKENMVNTPLTISNTFDLESYGKPKSVYLILGVKKLREVKLVDIKITTDEKSITITPDNLKDYFTENQYTSFDQGTGIIKTHKHNDKHVPLLSLNKRAFEILLLD